MATSATNAATTNITNFNAADSTTTTIVYG